MRSPRPALLILLAACGPAEPTELLVETDAWVVTDAAADPWADHRPAEVDCDPSAAFTSESVGFEIDTTFCNYVTLEQPMLRPVGVGDPYQLVLYHNLLWSEEDDVAAHVAFRVGDDTWWDETIPIPAEAKVWPVDGVAPADLEAGEKVYFHLHNHGSNTWMFVHLKVPPRS